MKVSSTKRIMWAMGFGAGNAERERVRPAVLGLRERP
jgi:hypothetical protein